MPITCKELKKSFDTKDALFSALVENKEEIIKQKKAEAKESRSSNLPLLENFDFEPPFKTKEGYFYAIINTTNLLDSHGDVHLPKIWNKSAKEQKGKTYYVADHELKISSVIVSPADVNIMLVKTTFKALGYDLDGETTALIYEMPIDGIKNEYAKSIIENKEQIENSIRMQYIDLILCVNSDSEDYKQEKKNWDKYYPIVANKEELDKRGYFWAVKEARIYKEGSMVLFGSNSATHIIYHKEAVQPSSDTEHKDEPLKNTQNKSSINLTIY